MLGAFPWRTAALLSGFAALEWLCWWSWSAKALRPLERYYLAAYFLSTEGAGHPGAKVEIEPLYITAPGRKPEIAIAEDVATGRTGDLPLQLSESACERGWTGIGKGRPMRDDAGAMEGALRDLFYQHVGFWGLAAEPMAEGGSLLLVLLCAAFTMREALTAEWRSLWAVATEPEMPRDYWRESLRYRSGIEHLLGLRRELLKWVQRLRLTAAHPASQTMRGAGIQRGPINDPSSTVPALLPPAPSPSDPVSFQSRDRRPHRMRNIPSAGTPTKASKRHRIFPGKAGVRATGKQAQFWDESQWID
jgi:hypothetical protein